MSANLLSRINPVQNSVNIKVKRLAVVLIHLVPYLTSWQLITNLKSDFKISVISLEAQICAFIVSVIGGST